MKTNQIQNMKNCINIKHLKSLSFLNVILTNFGTNKIKDIPNHFIILLSIKNCLFINISNKIKHSKLNN